MKNLRSKPGLPNQLGIFLCLKYLRSRKIVLLSIAAVAMSSALLITIASLFTGFIDAFENSATEHMGDIVIAAPAGRKIHDYDKLITDLEENPLIEAATGVLSSQGLLLIGKGNVRAVQVYGIELPKRAAVTPFADMLIKQKKLTAKPNFTTAGADYIGGFAGIGVIANLDDKTDEYDFTQAEKSIGLKVLLTTGTVIESDRLAGDSALPEFKRRTIRFTVTDVVFSGMYEIDKNFIYLPIETLSQKLYPEKPKLADAVHIKLTPGSDHQIALAVVGGIWQNFALKKFAWARSAKINTSIQMQAKLVTEYRKQMAMLMLVFGVVSGGVILLIFCIFYLIVMTKQKDIAVVKSCGLGSTTVAMIFVTFGLLIGLLGSALGVALGLVFTKNINMIERWISIALNLKLWKSSTYMFSRIPNQLNWESVIWVTIAAIVAAGIGALIPAITAARVKPVDILRYE